MTPPNHRNTARNMVFGVGITLGLYVGILSAFLVPLPVLAYRLKLGRAGGVAVSAIAFVAMAAILGSDLLGLFLFLLLLVLGFALGESFAKGFSIEKTMLVTCGMTMAVAVLALALYSHSAGVGIRELISGYAEKTIALYKSFIDQTGFEMEARKVLHERIDLYGQLILQSSLPGTAISGVLFMAWINLLLARPVLRKMGLPFPDFGSLNRWRAPEMLIWILIGCGILLLMPGGLKLIGINGLQVVLQVYFLQGIAIVSFFLVKQGLPPILRGILYVFVFTQPLMILLTGLSVFDMWLNVRKLGAENAATRE